MNHIYNEIAGSSKFFFLSSDSKAFPVILMSVNFIIAEVIRLFLNGESRFWVHDIFC